MKLSETTVKKSENLHLMRFLASIMVIFSHSFSVSTGGAVEDPLNRFTDDILSIGGVCVALFFLCSGYLISRSVMRADKFVPYISARLKRLFPPLAFVVFSTVVLGAFITSLSIKEYLLSPDTYKYFLNAVLLPTHNLPGVFTNNIYGTVANGSLWTLPVEFACYVACFIFFKLKLLEKRRFWYTVPLAVAVLLFNDYLPSLLCDMARPCLFFYIGMLFYVYREHIKLNIRLVPIALIALALCITVARPFTNIFLILFLPYILFTLWFAIPQCPAWLGKTGDISYGIYLWGFLVQQTLVFFWGGSMPQFLNFVLASVISICLGTVTFLITEKPLMKKRV